MGVLLGLMGNAAAAVVVAAVAAAAAAAAGLLAAQVHSVVGRFVALDAAAAHDAVYGAPVFAAAVVVGLVYKTAATVPCFMVM